MSEANETPADLPAEQQATSIHRQIAEAMHGLKATGDAGANWFYWIAGLSLVNTVITHSGGDRQFIVGLGVTAVVDAIATGVAQEEPSLRTIVTVIAVGFSIFISSIALLFGWLSRKRMLWIYGAGMFLYLLDGLIYLAFGVYLSAAFHAYALYSMFQGFKAYRELRKIEAHLEQPQTENSVEAGFETA